jgi:hypothetical protein
MTEQNDLDVMEYATLVDRTASGSEFVFDGRRYTFTGPKYTRIVPLYIADWLFRNDRSMVWTTGGDYVCRYGIKDAPDAFMDAIGAAAFDTDPITIDTTRAEGWNTAAVDLDPAARRVISLRRNPADFAHQGGTAAPTFSGKER